MSRPKPGELYVLWNPVEAVLEWLVVRYHPDDESLVLLVPADDFPFIGYWDVRMNPEFVDRPLSARCGSSVWLSASVCKPEFLVGSLPDEAVGRVRGYLATLARGQSLGDKKYNYDHNYEAWMQDVETAREYIANQKGA